MEDQCLVIEVCDSNGVFYPVSTVLVIDTCHGDTNGLS